jgi:hypothetical protein
MEQDWDSKAEYLRQTRNLYYNDDYLQFLITFVWKITHPSTWSTSVVVMAIWV